jgi:hypothetical protein
MNTPSELEANPSHQTALANAGVASLEVPSTGVGFPDYLPNLVFGTGEDPRWICVEDFYTQRLQYLFAAGNHGNLSYFFLSTIV